MIIKKPNFMVTELVLMDIESFKNETEKCRACNGSSELLGHDGSSFVCPACHGKGTRNISLPFKDTKQGIIITIYMQINTKGMTTTYEVDFNNRRSLVHESKLRKVT